ncbi:uncharacterized protein LOC142803719 isoform X3 [Rhipicephalus microplus]|uniref:uncharacterized protein LOC142803719 isoform X3 n=1 Tax=Rhipicephalus microplus TaxID=6941 RepID=UPI003F6C254E
MLSRRVLAYARNGHRLCATKMAAQVLRGQSTTTTTALEGYSGSSAREKFKLNPCTGRRQSPIELSTPRRSEKLQRARADLRMHRYDGPFSQYKVKDTEFGVKVRVLGGLQPSLKGTGLPGRFLLHNLHFHAGLDDSCGSEHTMDGKTFAMETPDGHLLRLWQAGSPCRRVPGPEEHDLRGMWCRVLCRRPRVLVRVCPQRGASSHSWQGLQATIPSDQCRPPWKEAAETRYRNTCDAGGFQMPRT